MENQRIWIISESRESFTLVNFSFEHLWKELFRVKTSGGAHLWLRGRSSYNSAAVSFFPTCSLPQKTHWREKCSLNAQLVVRRWMSSPAGGRRSQADGRQMDSPKVLTMQYMVLFSHRTVQLPVGREAIRENGHLKFWFLTVRPKHSSSDLLMVHK